MIEISYKMTGIEIESTLFDFDSAKRMEGEQKAIISQEIKEKLVVIHLLLRAVIRQLSNCSDESRNGISPPVGSKRSEEEQDYRRL